MWFTMAKPYFVAKKQAFSPPPVFIKTLNYMSITNQCWYVLYVKTRHEKKINDILQAENIETFLPLVKVKRNWSDRKKVILKPVFPSYIFFRVDVPSQFYKALSLKGVFCCIKFRNEYAVVNDAEIRNIKLLIGLDSVESMSVTNDNIKKGDIREFKHGPLAGLKCEILNPNNPNKILVRLESLKQSITATISSNYLSGNSRPRIKRERSSL